MTTTDIFNDFFAEITNILRTRGAPVDEVAVRKAILHDMSRDHNLALRDLPDFAQQAFIRSIIEDVTTCILTNAADSTLTPLPDDIVLPSVEAHTYLIDMQVREGRREIYAAILDLRRDLGWALEDLASGDVVHRIGAYDLDRTIDELNVRAPIVRQLKGGACA